MKILNVKNILGEGPIWHLVRGSIFWTDIEKKELWEYHVADNQINTWLLPEKIGTIAIDQNMDLILAMQNGIGRFNLNNYQFESLLKLEENIPSNRANEGKVGPDGKLWLGTMELNCTENAGSLYCIDHDLNVTKKLSDLTIANGMAWSKDYTYFYHIDSPTYQVKKYSFDVKKSEINFIKTAISIPKEMGMPDGMTIDEEGMLWIALWGGFAVQRWDPFSGMLLKTIKLPAPNITSCTFGGENLNELFITSARAGMNEEDLKTFPKSGSLFKVILNIKGFNPYKFGQNEQ